MAVELVPALLHALPKPFHLGYDWAAMPAHAVRTTSVYLTLFFCVPACNQVLPYSTEMMSFDVGKNKPRAPAMW